MDSKKDNKGSKDGRSRAWEIVAYPSSLPNNWLDILAQLYCPLVVSPLHDKDKFDKPEEHDGKIFKDPHRHIYLFFDGKKSYNQILDIAHLLGTTRVNVVHNTRSAIRYTTHIDFPKKAQYSIDDIIAMGGLDIKPYFENDQDRYQAISDMMTYIVDNQITEYWQFLDAARSFHFADWFRYLCDNCSYVIGQFIKSYRHDKDGAYKQIAKQQDNEVNGSCTEISQE